MTYKNKDEWRRLYKVMRNKHDGFLSEMKSRKSTLSELQASYDDIYKQRTEMKAILDSPSISPDGSEKEHLERWTFFYELYLQEILEKIQSGRYLSDSQVTRPEVKDWTLKDDKEFLVHLRSLYKEAQSDDMRILIEDVAKTHKLDMEKKFSTTHV